MLSACASKQSEVISLGVHLYYVMSKINFANRNVINSGGLLQ